MAQFLKVCTTLLEDLNLVLRTHTEQLTTTYNSNSRGFDALFWSQQALHLCAQTDAYNEKKILKKKVFSLKYLIFFLKKNHLTSYWQCGEMASEF